MSFLARIVPGAALAILLSAQGAAAKVTVVGPSSPHTCDEMALAALADSLKAWENQKEREIIIGTDGKLAWPADSDVSFSDLKASVTNHFRLRQKSAQLSCKNITSDLLGSLMSLKPPSSSQQRSDHALNDLLISGTFSWAATPGSGGIFLTIGAPSTNAEAASAGPGADDHNLAGGLRRGEDEYTVPAVVKVGTVQVTTDWPVPIVLWLLLAATLSALVIAAILTVQLIRRNRIARDLNGIIEKSGRLVAEVNDMSQVVGRLKAKGGQVDSVIAELIDRFRTAYTALLAGQFEKNQKQIQGEDQVQRENEAPRPEQAAAPPPPPPRMPLSDLQRTALADFKRAQTQGDTRMLLSAGWKQSLSNLDGEIDMAMLGFNYPRDQYVYIESGDGGILVAPSPATLAVQEADTATLRSLVGEQLFTATSGNVNRISVEKFPVLRRRQGRFEIVEAGIAVVKS